MKSDQRRPGSLAPRVSKDIQRQQERTLLTREQEVSSREESATLREQAISDAQALTDTQGDSNLQLREANEHLVIASIESHIMAEKLE